MNRWQSKIAVVTGASSGIGAGILKKLSENGVTVVGIARRVELIQKIAETLKSNSGKIHAIKCDVSKIDEIQKVFQFIKETIGPIQILINNAGIVKLSTIIDSDPNDLKQTIDTNILGSTVCAKEAIKQMIEHNLNGHIVNINSVFGHYVIQFPSPIFNIYPATKFAMTSLTETLLQEIRACGAQIKVTSISPGLVKTNLFNAPEIEDLIKVMPAISPEDVANGVLYALGSPPHLQVLELILRPVGEAY